MKVLIVTGGIGSGKSMVCSMLSKDYGYPVYEADKRVKELYLEHPRLMADIEDLESGFSAMKNGEMFIALYFESVSAAKDCFEAFDGINEYAEQEGRWIYWGTDEAKKDFKLF